jgi:hypothetical protein
MQAAGDMRRQCTTGLAMPAGTVRTNEKGVLTQFRNEVRRNVSSEEDRSLGSRRALGARIHQMQKSFDDVHGYRCCQCNPAPKRGSCPMATVEVLLILHVSQSIRARHCVVEQDV